MARKRRNRVTAKDPAVRGQGLAVLFLLIALVAIAIFLFDDRAVASRYRVDLQRVVQQAVPESDDAEATRASLLQDLESLENASILDGEFTREVQTHLESNPWVREVRGLRRRFPGGLELDVEFREAWAEVAVPAPGGVRYLLADDEGVVLPVVLHERRGLPYLLVVHPEGDTSTSAGTLSDGWLRSAVREGVQVLHDLEEEHDHEGLAEVGIRSIDVSNHVGRLDRRAAEISIVTARTIIEPGSGDEKPLVLRWGRSTAHRLARIELSTERKLDNLLDLIKSRPGALEGLREIELRFDDPFGRRP